MNKTINDDIEGEKVINKIDINSALTIKNAVFIDVRSPKEFAEGTIPGAINIPLLDNNERIVVGTIYKQQSPEEAKVKGLEFISYKLVDIYKEVLKLSHQYSNVIIFCWRGGLRSASVVNLLTELGIKTQQLIGGYKSYRKEVMNFFDNLPMDYSFVVLHGLTGVGKTEMIEALEEKGIATLDLEDLAQNSGSVFGNVNYQYNKVPQKQFESELYHRFLMLNSKNIIVESESSRIGAVHIPKNLYNRILDGKHILLETSMEGRINRLVNAYASYDSTEHKDILKEAISKLEKRFGTQKTNECLKLIDNGEYEKVTKELITNYYDPLYNKSIDHLESNIKISFEDINDAIDEIVSYYSQLEGKI
ncbi:Rhodanese domain protein [Alkaliphilus metalliredigens QYMF]|uniref:Rhodanese domain protein n=1 Tax=Alkaliphilus metalliredigens (strain QYMF) TaxID=293826 RepID=A6TRJ5_ALKMQ|nr:tRNA 2-selenouridine(34) synthase MnmH [Alkaliphilus metalliredigens]ABR48813.1 Rhodanese domain protein [Alkaliphilus metalliredigens QYMF]